MEGQEEGVQGNEEGKGEERGREKRRVGRGEESKERECGG